MTTGTYTVADLQTITNETVASFGLEDVARTLLADLAAYNAVINEMTEDLAESTTDRERIYGASAAGEMYRADEYDRGLTEKAGRGSNVAFPLYKFVRDVGWTRDYMLQNTPQQIANTVIAIQSAHTRAMRREIQTAIFGSANYTTFDEFRAPQRDLAVKRFLNADGAPIPNGPNGEVFNASTHTHYDFVDSATPTGSALTALIEDVIEHGHGSRVLLNINRGAEAAVRALTGFTPYQDARLTLATNVNQAAIRLDQSRVDNRAIGLYDAAEVWVRSWVPNGYVFAFDAGSPLKPLVMRQHPVAAVRGLRIVATHEDYPLYAQDLDSYFGFGAWTRTNGAVLYYATGAVAYVAPTF